MTKARDGVEDLKTIDANLAAKAPLASPSFTGTGSVNGKLVFFDGNTQTRNGGVATEANAALINFGLNEGSGNRFGGSYNQASQGGMLNFDTRANQPLFQIYGRAAGVAEATGTALLNIDSAGRVTKPLQPSFRAYMAQNAFTLAANTKFPYNATEHNIGNYFNTSTNTFTAPVAGSYFFHFYTIVQAAVTNGHFAFTISGSSISKGKNVHFSKANTGWNAVHHSGVFKLSTGTTVSVFNHSASQQIHGNSWTSFSGYLIG